MSQEPVALRHAIAATLIMVVAGCTAIPKPAPTPPPVVVQPAPPPAAPVPVTTLGWEDRALTPGMIASIFASGGVGKCRDPLIVSQPANQIVDGRSNGTFFVNVIGSPPLSYQWLRNGLTVAGATNASLVLNPQFATVGSYSVIVSNAFGSVTSQVATLTVETTFSRLPNAFSLPDSGMSAGAGWGDYDNDGDLDLFIFSARVFVGAATPPTNALYRNEGNGTFTRILAGSVVTDTADSHSGAWGDYDNDGLLDLFVATDGDELLYRNTGNGNFTRMTNGPVANQGMISRGAAWADYDRDGLLDLFVANYGHDVSGTNNGGDENFLFHNNGNGTFTRITNGVVATDRDNSLATAWADYDHDGWPDLFVANYADHGGTAEPDALYHNNHDGTFTRIQIGEIANDTGRGVACAWGDFNNDGFLDLFVANYGQTNFLYRNNGNGTFTRLTNSSIGSEIAYSTSGAWGDYDNDGFLDLFVGNVLDPTTQTNFLYHNNGDETFTRITAGSLIAGEGSTASGVWGDYDNDGFLDLLLANTLGRPNSLYRNNANSNGWCVVRCVGSPSNRSAIGTRVRVDAIVGGVPRSQTREITSSPTDGLRAQFGLGDATSIDVLRIEWPSGKVQEFTNVAPRQFLTIQEQTTFYFAVNGSGSVSYSPVRSNYFIGEPITLTATPRNPNWTRFLRWSDGNTNTSRTITVGLSNSFTAIFTNFVALEELVFRQWEANFGGTSNDLLTALAPTSDGGYILGGYSSSGASGNKTSGNFGANDFWVVKVNASGSKQWEASHGGTSNDVITSLASTSDGGCLLGGWSESGVSGNKTSGNFGSVDFWVVKLNANGGKLWETNYGGTGNDPLQSLTPTSDGGCLIGGASDSGVSGNKTSGNFGNHDYWVVKLDANGGKQWEASYGGSGGDVLRTLAPTSDGGYLLGGYSARSVPGCWPISSSCSWHARARTILTCRAGGWTRSRTGFRYWETAVGNKVFLRRTWPRPPDWRSYWPAITRAGDGCFPRWRVGWVFNACLNSRIFSATFFGGRRSAVFLPRCASTAAVCRTGSTAWKRGS